MLFLHLSCGFFEKNEEEKVLAKVGEKYLYASDLKEIKFPQNAEDSISKLRSYQESWVNKQLLLQKALENLTEEQANFSEQLEDYKHSLLIYAYENQLISQKLDTTVNDRDIREYYQMNQQNFSLKEQLFKLRFVKVIRNAPTQDSLKLWLFSEDDFNDRLMNYCTQFALSCHLDTSIWLSLSSLKKVLSNDSENLKRLKEVKEPKLIFSDSTQSVLMHIFESREVGEKAPVNYVKEQIKDIVVNKRKIKLLSKAKREILEEATLENYYQIYE